MGTTAFAGWAEAAAAASGGAAAGDGVCAQAPVAARLTTTGMTQRSIGVMFI
jgi:hypothetical protein